MIIISDVPISYSLLISYFSVYFKAKPKTLYEYGSSMMTKILREFYLVFSNPEEKVNFKIWQNPSWWDEVREWHGHIYTTKCKIDS